MKTEDMPVGTELRSAHGTQWVKTAPNEWCARGDWGTLDRWTTYSDNEVYGEVIDDARSER